MLCFLGDDFFATLDGEVAAVSGVLRCFLSNNWLTLKAEIFARNIFSCIYAFAFRVLLTQFFMAARMIYEVKLFSFDFFVCGLSIILLDSLLQLDA